MSSQTSDCTPSMKRAMTLVVILSVSVFLLAVFDVFKMWSVESSAHVTHDFLRSGSAATATATATATAAAAAAVAGGPRFCRFATRPQVGDFILPLPVSNITVGYPCAGPAYNQCAEKASRLFNSSKSLWGVQGEPLYKPNSSILFVGNSHTRQVFEALVCQYNSEIIKVTGAHPKHALTVHFEHNITMTSSINSPEHHTPAWHYHLEQTLGRPLDSYDAIVLGQFNSLKKYKESAFYSRIVSDAVALNISLDEDFFAEGFGLAQLERVYRHKIIALTNVALDANETVAKLQAVIDDITATTGRDNLLALSGKRYIRHIGQCSHVEKKIGLVSAAGTEKVFIRHRCIGGAGGHPDLLAWDIVEALHRFEAPR